MKFYYSGIVRNYIEPRRGIKQKPEELVDNCSIMLSFVERVKKRMIKVLEQRKNQK